ncbi:Metallo-dependent phosphatase [Colletotrichum zoysiae]|uniref:Metallo-dependent phosphatase n=1 Tax=Colletotrichum zoysiae TaxID=1216348 RepID=A0AAD9H3Q5_9PEZI|nr:Metallo-dependent phosphatase [Colletotrichum zoysiae]
MSYGSAARPGFADLSVHIASLPERHRPSRAHPGRRLVVVGDVHGMRASLDRLLDDLRFDPAAGDHLVLAGDMINKGPDSRGVLDLAMRLGASAVRGNHEDRVLLAHKSMRESHVADEDAHGNPESEQDDLEPAVFPHGDSQERATARGLSRKHLAWLASLPVILEAGAVEGLGDLVVVHAGLVPGVPLARQDPWAVMNMRGLVAVPTDRRDGGASSWPKAWDAHQRRLPERRPRTAVAYGHDSKRGLRVGRYTFGLDSGCVGGGDLSALVIEATAEGVTHAIRSVSCAGDEGRKKKSKGGKHKKGRKGKKQEEEQS